jgi:hypothetical protein
MQMTASTMGRLRTKQLEGVFLVSDEFWTTTILARRGSIDSYLRK